MTVVSVTGFAVYEIMHCLSLMRLQPSKLDDFKLDFCGKLGFNTFQILLSELRALLADCLAQLVGRMQLLVCADDSQSCLYKCCQRPSVLGTFHLEAKQQKD